MSYEMSYAPDESTRVSGSGTFHGPLKIKMTMKSLSIGIWMKKILILSLLVIGFWLKLFAPPPPPPPDASGGGSETPVGGPAPIGSSTALLVGLSALYCVKVLVLKQKKTTEQDLP